MAGAAVAFDEMFAPDGEVRLPYRQIHAALAQMSTDELRERTEALASSYLAQGVAFDFAGEERPFPLDAVPRVVDRAEWSYLGAGGSQRVRALGYFLTDTCGAQRCIADGVMPARLISSSRHYHRSAAGIESAITALPSPVCSTPWRTAGP